MYCESTLLELLVLNMPVHFDLGLEICGERVNAEKLFISFEMRNYFHVLAE